LFYSKRRFKNYAEMEREFKRYHNRYNNIARRILNFKTPNEIVEDYFFKNTA
jgi:IS30 family transposase